MASLRRLWLIAAAFLLVGVWRSVSVGIPFRDPGGQYLVTRVLLTLGLCTGFAVVEAIVVTPRGSRRPRGLRATFRRRWPRARLLIAAAGLLAYHLVYFTYHNLKSWDSLNTPRDGELTRLDQWLFLGHSPAVLLHDLLGQHLANWALIAIYESFPSLVVAVVAGSVFVRDIRDGLAVLASLIWVWILGTISYYAVPSLGPFQDRPQDFAGLPPSIVSRTQDLYMAQRAHLLAHPHASDAFAQVSAFASLHVGVTTVITLMAAHLGHRRAARVLGLYLALTCVATVYLGWHFVVDDVAGLAIGWGAVRLGVLTTSAAPRPLERRPVRLRAGTPT